MNKRQIWHGALGVAAFVLGGLVTRIKILEGIETIEVKYLGWDPVEPDED